LANFEISQSGSRINWPSADLDLILDDFRAVCDAEFAQQQKQIIAADVVRYGSAIRDLRREKGLRQSDVECVSEREVRRIEQGQHVPRLKTLQKLAQAHGMAFKDYLNALAARTSLDP